MALQPYFVKLRENEELKTLYDETSLGHYGWEGFIEENIFAAFCRFLKVKLKTKDKFSMKTFLSV